MGLFSTATMNQINAVIEKSKENYETVAAPKMNSRKMDSQLKQMSSKVIEYFKDSPSILITKKSELHDYITKMIESGYGAVDTETTGLDRINDTIVGASLYYPGGIECYIPNKHLVPKFNEPYKDQLTYDEMREEFQRLADSEIRLIFANADYDLGMIYKDYKVDFCDRCFYDVLTAWRCLKENEPRINLKALYNKYVLRGKGDPMKFNDFFTPDLFPFCRPEVAKLYAANDAKITFELFEWQLPYVTPDHPKCKKNHLESIASLVWNIEFPLIRVVQNLHRRGVYLEKDMADMRKKRYLPLRDKEMAKLREMVNEILENPKYSSKAKRPFRSSADFNCNSSQHVAYLLYDWLKLDGKATKERKTGKTEIAEFNLPITKQISYVRSLDTLISTFILKLPDAVAGDQRIHCSFKSMGAATGRMSSTDPNMQNIPARAEDIRHMFRASPGYVLMSSDYS